MKRTKKLEPHESARLPKITRVRKARNQFTAGYSSSLSFTMKVGRGVFGQSINCKLQLN